MIFGITDDGKMSINIYPLFSYTACYNALFLWIFLANKIIIQVQRVFKAKQIVDKKWMENVANILKLVEQYIEEEKYLHKKHKSGK
jgi:hypothetical protein